MTEQTTHFGYQSVPVQEKVRRVGEVFDSVASRYDLMNDVLSFGVHRIWKRLAIFMSPIKAGHRVLDLAGGTGDLAALLAPRVGDHGQVVLADINASMLNAGRERLLDQGFNNTIRFVQADAESLPFADNHFDVVTMAFGLRNVTTKENALKEICRVLKPGGQALIVEFSTPIAPGLKPLYDFYSFNIMPKLGQWIAEDADSYRYLAESIRMHPNQETLKNMMLEAGFDTCKYLNLSGGIVAIHKGYKY